jgi:hypothetical protein
MKQQPLARVLAFLAPACCHRVGDAGHIHHVDCRSVAKFLYMACRSRRPVISLVLQLPQGVSESGAACEFDMRGVDRSLAGINVDMNELEVS